MTAPTNDLLRKYTDNLRIQLAECERELRYLSERTADVLAEKERIVRAIDNNEKYMRERDGI